MMKLLMGDDHKVIGAQYHPVLKTNARMPVRRFLVMHFTAGASGLSSIEYWRSPRTAANAHFVIERDGTVLQCVPCNVQAWHAGKSQWRDPKTKQLFVGLNSCSIGIELANAGSDDDALDWARKQPGFASIKARHKAGGPVVEWEAYPQAQLDAARELAEVLVKRYNLDDVIGHDDIAPGRKDDPGPAFPMAEFRKSLGFPAEIVV